MWLRIVVPIVVLLLSGCANYRAVSTFGNETTTMTGVVKDEFDQIETLCVRQAELAIVVSNLPNDGPIDQCRRSKRAQGQFAALTVVVLDNYAEGLSALADDKSFDLSPEMKTMSGRVRGLKDNAGNPVVSAREATALSTVSDVIVNAFASARRDEAVKQMVAATPDLMVVGQSLRAFFVAPADASPAGPKAPYANLVTVISGSGSSTQSLLESSPMRRAEPIRTAELLRDLRTRQKLLAKRAYDVADSVPARVVAAIDAWLDALQKFSTDALKPDSRELVDRLKALRNATRAAKDAVADR